MNKFLSITTIVVFVFLVSCSSTKRQIKRYPLLADLRQKIENRDFTVTVKFSDDAGDPNATFSKQKILSIKGDSLISNMNMALEHDYKGLSSSLPSKNPDQKFVVEIYNYKVTDDRRKSIEVTFDYKGWSSVEMDFFTESYRMVINYNGIVAIYCCLDPKFIAEYGKIE